MLRTSTAYRRSGEEFEGDERIGRAKTERSGGML